MQSETKGCIQGRIDTSREVVEIMLPAAFRHPIPHLLGRLQVFAPGKSKLFANTILEKA